jgi:phage repressor protein C with HTH and peptisase S24 domain
MLKHKHVFQTDASQTFIVDAKAELTLGAMDKDFGKRLRDARKAAGLTINGMAQLIGVTYPAAQQWEAGKTFPATENLLKLRKILGFDLSDNSAPTLYEPEPNAVIEPGPVYLPVMNGPSDIQELGATMGGDADDESAFELNGQVIDLVKRPPGLMHRKDVFALRVTNISMFPKFEDGERIYLEKRKPAIGDYIVVELYPTEEGRPGKSYIKRLLAADSTKITVQQFNPRGELNFRRSEIKQLLRVIPQNELLGI